MAVGFKPINAAPFMPCAMKGVKLLFIQKISNENKINAKIN